MDPDTLDSKHVTFPGGAPEPTEPSGDVDGTQAKEKALRKRHSKKKTTENLEITLDDIASDASDAPRKLKLEEVCHVQNEDTALGGLAHTTEDYLKQRTHENNEFEENALSSLESLAPFKLKWVYGRLPHVKAINLTGLYKNHIAYASSNIVIIYDFVGNEQQCLQGHKNTITALALDKQNRFFASADSGHRSLIIIWDSLTGKALKFFPEPHDGKGCITLAFTGVDFILASIGNEEPGKQSVCLWDFNPKNQKKHPVVIGQFPHNTSDLLRELTFDDNRPEFFTATGDRSIVFCTWIRVGEQSEQEQTGDSIFCYKPRTRRNFMAKYKKFCNSLWMKEGKWLVTSTMSGYLCVWTPPVTLALEDPPDPKKNVRELKRYYKLSEDGLTCFTVYKEYAVVGDEKGIIRFFDHDLKLLRWTKNFFLPSVNCISFNLTDEIPAFKKMLRATFDKESKNYLKRQNNSRVRDYSLGGVKDRELSMTTIQRPPMPCTDFVFSAASGDIYYYHFNQAKIDLLVNGTPGKFVTCDVCPSSNNVVFCTRKGEVQVYDFVTHKRMFGDQIFVGSHKVSTMKFHPTGFFLCFGLVDGHLCFRRNFSWKTFIQPMFITSHPILRIIFSEDGLLLSYFTNNKIIVLLKYLPKTRSFVTLGKCRTHQLDICDVQFLHDPKTGKNRLFSLGLDRYLIEYDIENCNPGDPKGLRVLKILRLEETCQPTAMVFDGPAEFGVDCITFSNTLNKLRMFQYNQERVRGTVAGPVFGREHAINRMIEFPAQMSPTRFKKFIIFVRGNKLGIIDTPMDGNPHKYMAVLTHPGPIIDISVIAEKQQIFTIGHQDNAALQWEASVRSVEATVIMGGSGITPFYHNLRRNWGGACQDVVKDIDLIFFFLNLKRVDTQTDIFNITRTIRISEIPAVCRACGFYPSEYEVDLMIDEARRIKMLDQHYTDDFTTEFSFEDFIKLFSNHYYRISESEIEDAFRFLGFEEKEDPYICRSDFVYFLTTEGEKLKPYDFPIYFESMYLDQSLTVFSDVQCHIRQAMPSITSDTPGYTGAEVTSQVEETQVESFSSSSSSTLTADMDDDDSAEHLSGKGSSEGDKDADQDMADDDDDDDDEEEEGEGVEKKPPKKKKEVVVREEVVEEELADDEIGETEDTTDQMQKKGSMDEKAKRFSGSSGGAGGENQEEEQEDDTEELMDLPERIDLSFFLSKMLPPECQQTIRWRPEFRQKRAKDLTPRPEVLKRKRNQEYYDTLMKQLIDPNFPIHKKLLNALYAEHYMEHGDFSVPEELQYPGYGPSIDESWFHEEGEEDMTKHDDDVDESPALSLQDSLLDAKEVEDEEGEDEEKKKGKGKHKAAKDEEDEEMEEGEIEGEEEEGEEYFIDEEEAVQAVQQQISMEYGGEDEEETLPIAAAIFQSFKSDEYEMLGEDDSTHYNYETEEGEDASAFSAPFSISEQGGSREGTVEGGSEDGRTGIVPGYNSDNTEYTSDVENVYEEEDAAFIREVNESFRPAQTEEAEEGSGEAN